MQVRFFNPGLTYQKNRGQLMGEIDRVLSNGDLILRADVEKFEENLAKFVGTKYAVGLNSGTDALYLALKAIGIEAGMRVAVPSHTFVATAQVVAQIGAEPALFDLGEDGSHLVVDAHMVAHIAGELSPLPSVNFPIIEDACQALGAVKNPTTAVQCWSFYPAKILGAFGDAGALTTNDKAIYDYVVEARNHFKTDYSKWGINSRLDNLQAAILNVKFKYLEDTLQKRAIVAARYQSALKDLPLERPNDVKGRVWQDYVIRTNKRNALFQFLTQNGIETMCNEYPFPIPKGQKALQYESQTLRLPINENITSSEVDYVIEKIKEFYGA